MLNNRYLDLGASTVCYRVEGKGKALVLLHGFGEDGNIWNDLTIALKDQFRILIPDLPGSGKSTILKTSHTELSVEDYAEVIMRVLEKENVTACTIIGHSMGGYITLAIAEKYPEILNGFGLFHSTAFADNEEKKQNRRRSIAFIEENGAANFLKKSIPDLFSGKFKKEHAGVVDTLIDSFKYFSNESLIQYQRAMINRPERTKVLAASRVPVLFIIGEQDTAVPLQQSLLQCHMAPLSHVHILSGSGHMGMLEENKRSAGIITSYLNNV